MIATSKLSVTARGQTCSLPFCCHRAPGTNRHRHPFAPGQRYLVSHQRRNRTLSTHFGTACLLHARNIYFCTSILLASAGQRHAHLRAAQSTSIGQPHQYGLMIECDGVLVDIHKDCHRVAFNMAFEVRLYVRIALKAPQPSSTPFLHICNMPADSIIFSS